MNETKEKKVQVEKDFLIREFKDAPYVKQSPFGNAATTRKIYNYIITCVDNGVSQSGCKDWIRALFQKENVQEFELVNIAIDAIYKYVESH